MHIVIFIVCFKMWWIVSIDVFDNIDQLAYLVTLELANCDLLDGTLNANWANIPFLSKMDLSGNSLITGSNII